MGVCWLDTLGAILQIVFILLIILFIVSILASALQNQRRDFARLRTIMLIERQRQTRVITLIHRQERVSLLGIPLIRYIDVEDAEQILQAIRLTPRETPIDLILHTPGGLTLPAQQIAYALKEHPAPVTIMVPHYAMSGGSLIALAATNIMMDRNAVLGAVDPQIGNNQQFWPAASILAARSLKDYNRLDDTTLILADIASKALSQMRAFVLFLVRDHLPGEQAEDVADIMTSGRWTHDYPLTVPVLHSLGLKVTPQLPPEVYRLMRLYPQPGAGQPAVDFIPMPYTRRNNNEQHHK
jgi:ClpP class serine protease